MKYLDVFDGVRIPVDYASTQTYALLAKRDGGKTYTTLLIEEQMCDAGLFFVVLDPVGKHWALRAGADGRATGGKPDVYVLGGLHGDLPLQPGSGELVADVVVEHPGRYVLDVSGFETDADQDKFALAFGKRLFRRKQRDPGFPILLILEEAESFIPERPQPGQAPMLGAYGRIMRQGRNYGLGMLMVAQRAQALNKGVLSQAEVLIVKQMAHNRDVGAVDEWVKANGTPEQRAEMLGSLAELAQNEAWVWSPSWLHAFARAKVHRRVTFDSSASVKGGQTAAAVKLTPLNIAALGERMATTAERAKAEDPKELRRQIAALKRELAQRPTEKQVETVTETVEVPAVGDEVVERLTEAVDELAGAAGKIVAATNEISMALARVTARRREPAPAQRPAAAPPRAPTMPAPRSEPAVAGDFTVAPPQQRILDALAMLEQIGLPTADKTQLALFAGTKPTSGGYKNNLGALRNQGGLIEYPSPGTVALTDAGRAIADASAAPSTTQELHDLVRGLVPTAQWAIIELLANVYPDALTRKEVADRVDVPVTSGGFKNNLGRLRSLGLIDYPASGMVAALPVLFLEAAA